MRTFRLLLTFYRSFAFASNAISISCLLVLVGFGENAIHLIQAFFWFKAASLGLIVFVINHTRKKEFYYYRNLGLSGLKLWLPTLTFDFLLFVILLVSIASRLYEIST